MTLCGIRNGRWPHTNLDEITPATGGTPKKTEKVTPAPPFLTRPDPGLGEPTLVAKNDSARPLNRLWVNVYMQNTLISSQEHSWQSSGR